MDSEIELFEPHEREVDRPNLEEAADPTPVAPFDDMDAGQSAP